MPGALRSRLSCAVWAAAVRRVNKQATQLLQDVLTVGCERQACLNTTTATPILLLAPEVAGNHSFMLMLMQYRLYFPMDRRPKWFLDKRPVAPAWCNLAHYTAMNRWARAIF